MNVSTLMVNAKEALTRGNVKAASDFLNKGIIALSLHTLEGTTHVEGESVDRWKERFWQSLEDNDLIED